MGWGLSFKQKWCRAPRRTIGPILPATEIGAHGFELFAAIPRARGVRLVSGKTSTVLLLYFLLLTFVMYRKGKPIVVAGDVKKNKQKLTCIYCKETRTARCFTAGFVILTGRR